MHITEVIMFGYEIQLLKAHVTEHRPHVDRMVVWEAPVTVTGRMKPVFTREVADLVRFLHDHDVETKVWSREIHPHIAPSLDQTEWWRRFRTNEHARFPFLQADACAHGTDWIRYSDVDEITLDAWWPTLRTRLDEHPDWMYAEMRGAECLGFVNHKSNWGGVTRYRWCRGFPHLDPSMPKGHPRGPLFTRKKDYNYRHFVNCFSEPHEFFFKTITRWEMLTDPKLPQVWAEWERFDPAKLGMPFVEEGPWERYIDYELLPRYMAENRNLFPRVFEDQRVFPWSVTEGGGNA